MNELAVHPFVALMRTYCIDYTNAHDQSLYDRIMEPDYVVHIGGFDLDRDGRYHAAVAELFRRAPGLGLVVHDLVLNGDRLCMRFSEHGSFPTDAGPRLACWAGIGLYKWNGRRLTENHVEQDYLAMQRQLDTGVPDALEPPHLDPWTTASEVAADSSTEDAVRAWLTAGGDLGGTADPVKVTDVVVNDLFSAGRRAPFHATVRGPYAGGLDGIPADAEGTTVAMQIAGIAAVADDGTVTVERAVSNRAGVVAQLTGRPLL